MANLVIMESPTKAATVKGYLGSGYKVVASNGHVRDLPVSRLGIDVENNFKPHYINIRKKGDLIKKLIKDAKGATTVYLATDPDREGEAISWHLAAVLGIPLEKTKRITFNEISKTAVKKAIKNPRPIDMDLVNSQQARRLLDRIVGYKLSPYLWKTVKSGLSAGRVQSVATRAIVDREEEIKSFKPEEYWTITAMLANEDDKVFKSRFFGMEKKIELQSKEQTEEVLAAIEGKPFTVRSVKKSVKQRNPAPPFTTSSLQQEANKKLGFSSAKTMKVAQELYEGISLGSAGTHGLITYMRTDSLRISDEAAEAARLFIVSHYGEEYYPKTKRVYKSKAGAQDAHEAIRPANLEYAPTNIKSHLSADQFKLYNLIWNCFMASQMASAQFDTVSADIECAGYTFKSSGSTLRFAGFLSVFAVTEENSDDSESTTLLPELNEGQMLSSKEILPEQHFTEPPARYTEASLIKFLEEKGIGRPSTYATILTTVTQRGYVNKEGKSLYPTELGVVTTELMKEKFANIVDYGFTADMEAKLDDIENGETDMNDILAEFYNDFAKELDSAMATAERRIIKTEPEPTDIICEKCGAQMVVKSGRFGKFAACPNYPTCKNTKPLAKDGKSLKETKPAVPVEGEVCEKCGAPIVLRQGRYGSFHACSNYPKCDFTRQLLQEIGIDCPLCGKSVVTKKGRNKTVFYSCSGYPDCSFSSWDMPTKEKCPTCGEMLFRKKGKPLLICHKEGCGYKQEIQDNET
ncbi:MAG: type I DNA topoisomerase [Ruminococcaceae bacterium]|nr:type I DNA topoisomerase [Oscillospiraceae bacterium]